MLRRLAVRIVAAWRRRATVEELSKLSDRGLADIGLGRAQLPHGYEQDFALMRDIWR